MKKIKTTAIFLVLIMAFALFATPISANSSYNEPMISFGGLSHGNNITGKFNFPLYSVSTELSSENKGEGIYYYSDSYFTLPSNEYNSHLATMSMALAMTAFTRQGETSDSCYKNAEKLFSDIGFENFETNCNTDCPPTPETIGVVMAQKNVVEAGELCNLVAIAIRGDGYGSEWAGNMLVGKTDECKGNHKGFYDARDRALEFVSDYIKRNTEGKTKLWITGYSRAAAVSGLVGAWLNDNTSTLKSLGATVENEDIFTYTFEAPASTDEKNLYGKEYTNIFNIVSKSDPVVYLPLSENKSQGWNFVRPGIDKILPVFYKNEAEELNKIIQSINPDLIYDIHNFVSLHSVSANTQEKFLESLFYGLAGKIDRDTYVENMQGALCEIMVKIGALSDKELAALADDLILGIYSDLGISDTLNVESIVRIINSVSCDYDSDGSIVNILGNNLVRVDAVDEFDEELKICLSTLATALFKNDAFETNLTSYVVTMILNTVTREIDGYEVVENRIITAHIPEMVFSSLMFCDDYYSNTPEQFLDAALSELSTAKKLSVLILGERYEYYYYRGDEVNVSVSLPLCMKMSGWYAGEKCVCELEVCSFILEEDCLIEAEINETHKETGWITYISSTNQRDGEKYKKCEYCDEITETAAIPMFKAISSSRKNQSFDVIIISAGAVLTIVTVSATAIWILRRKNSKNETEDE